MSERPYPYPSQPLYKWAETHGVNSHTTFPALANSGFVIGVLPSREISAKAVFTNEIIANLPLEDCTYVLDPRQKPDTPSQRQKKVYKAPEGMAFQIEAAQEDANEAIDFVGEYLDLDVYGSNLEATITVFAQPDFHVVQTEVLETIYLPSKYDPSQDGATVAFMNPIGWNIYAQEHQMSGQYSSAKITLVPIEAKNRDQEFWVANFEQNDRDWYALDDFAYYPEEVALAGIVRFYGEHTPNHTGKLILPPIPNNEWGDLYDDHGILLKLNPYAAKSRFVTLDYRYGQSSVEYKMREVNTLLENDGMFFRALAVRGLVGNISLRDVIKAGVPTESLREGETLLS